MRTYIYNYVTCARTRTLGYDARETRVSCRTFYVLINICAHENTRTFNKLFRLFARNQQLLSFFPQR